MQIRMQGSRLGIEKAGKPANNNAFLAMPDDVSSVGCIRYIGEVSCWQGTPLGTKIIFGKDYHQVRIDGRDILVMPDTNVYAIVEDTRVEETSQG